MKTKNGLSLFAKDRIIYLENSRESMAKNNKNCREACLSKAVHYSSAVNNAQSFCTRTKLKMTVKGKAQVIRAPRKRKCLGKN